eukprot:1382082-Amorphochlora_amoeboformis.AAC.2
MNGCAETELSSRIAQLGIPLRNGRYAIERKFIARGGSCDVCRGRDLLTNAMVVFKIYRSSIEFGRERYVLNRVKHPNVVAMVDNATITCRGRRVMIQPFAMNGDLMDNLQRFGGLESKLERAVGIQLIEGLEAIHAQHIIHRDLKPENILLDERFTPKICDFGVSGIDIKAALEKGSDGDVLELFPERFMSARIGTMSYMAPEVLKGELQTKAVDVWSLGVVLFILGVGHPPFRQARLSDDCYKLMINDR